MRTVFKPPFLKHLCVTFIFSLFFFRAIAGDEPIPVGSRIINMGVTPQTVANGLKPYGLVYALLDAGVPIKWSISQSKNFDGVDFSYNGTSYKGGTFIIPAPISAATTNIINIWTAQGVQVSAPTTSVFTAPINSTLKMAPRITLDAKNGSIAQAFITAAGIPAAFYYFKDPQLLSCCDDVYAMPHADPSWATHSNLYTWNQTCKGSIWAACHAVSALENSFNPADRTKQLNFLSNTNAAPTGGGPFSASPGNSLILWGNHSDGSVPPPYKKDFATDPVMQFMGQTDAAQSNGSEQIYLPVLGGSWRSSTKVSVWDNSQADVPTLSPGKAAKMAYGQGFGDPNRGKVMYEGGHDISGTSPDNIAAQRAFLNFVLWAGQDKAFKVTANNIPAFVPGGTTVAGINASLAVTIPSGPYTYKWISGCGGTFTNATGTFNTATDAATASITSFTAPTAPTNSFPCAITCQIVDVCGRKVSEVSVPTIQSLPSPPVAVRDFKSTIPNTVVSVSALSNDSDPNNDPLTLSLIGSKITANGQFALAADGKTVMYKPNSGFIGRDSIQYKICDPGPLCSTAYVVINVGEDPGPCGTGKELAVIGTGYGVAVFAQTGTISNPLNSLGSFNNTGTKLAKATNSTITIDLGYAVYKNDNIVLKLASGDSKGTTFLVTSGATSGTLADPLTIKNIIKANSFGTYNYVVLQDSVRFIKISVASTNLYDSYVDGISYPMRGCIPKCLASEKTIKSTKYAASVFSQTGVSSPTNALGLPNNSGAELSKGSTDVLILDLGEVVPQGTPILLYLASKSATTTTTGVTFPVSSSLDGVTFSGVVSHPITSYAPQFTACKYIVTQASGIRYLKIAAASGTEDGAVDGVIFTSVKCLPISPVAKNDTVKICEDNAYAFDPRTNDYDPQNLPLSVKITSAPTNGLTTVDISGKITFVPNKDFNGADQIKYQVCNTAGFCSEATIFITIPDDGCAVGTYKPTIFTPQTAIITVGEDTWLDQNNPDKNNGIATTLSVNTRAGQINRSIIKFNIGSASIPADAIITSATLRLYKTGSKTETVKIYREITPWTEGIFSNATGDPSWNEVTAGNKWLSGTGGDYDSTHLVVSKLIPVTNGYIDFDVSSLAKQWIDGGLPNQGFLLRAATEGGSDNPIIFNSTEASTNKPELVINYQLIDCTTSACTIIPNKPPLAFVSDTCTKYNTSIQIDVVATAKDPDNNLSPASLAILSGFNGFPKSGTASVSGGKLLYTPNNLSVKTDTVYYKICDLGSPSLCDTSYAIICINNVPIIANDDAGTTPAGSPISISVKSNDINPLGGPTTLSDVPLCPPANGTIVIQGDNIVYTPNNGFTGIDVFKYITCNNNFTPICDTAKVTITVLNNAPITENDTVTTAACKPILIDVLANDGDPEGNNLVVISVQDLTPSTAGTISFSRADVTFSPSPTATGQIRFTYTVQDDGINPKQTTDTVVVNIGVPPINNAPIAVNDTASTISGQALYWNVRNNDSEPDGEQFNIKLPSTVKKPSNGSVSLTPNGLIQYIPNAGFVGKDTLEYQICDTISVSSGCTPRVNLCSVAKLFINVFPLPIEAVPDTSSAIVGIPTKISILANDKNPDGTSVTDLSKVTLPLISTQPLKGTVSVNPDGTISYTANAGTTGSDTLIYTICDVLNPTICDTAKVIIKIIPKPVANPDGIIPVLNAATTIPILSNDKNPDGTPVTDLTKITPPVISTPPTKGTVVVNPDGTVTYTPTAGASGTDTFIYTICDKVNTTLCDTAKVTVNIGTPPIANPDGIIPVISATTIPILSNDKNADGTPVTDLSKITAPEVTTSPLKGTVVVNPDGTVTYTPTAGSNGTDTFIYTICDKVNTTLCDTAKVTVNIVPINVKPLASPDVISTSEDVPVTIPVLGNDTFGTDGASIGKISINTPPNPLTGTASVNDNGTPNDPTDDKIVFVPALNYSGTTTLIYQICDATGDCDTAKVTITINPVNDPPVANLDVTTTFANSPIAFNIVSNDTDIDGKINPATIDLDPLTEGIQTSFTVVNQGIFMADPATGVVVFTPVKDYFGTVTPIIYQVCDTGTPLPIQCDTAKIYVQVLPVNYPPIGTEDINDTPINTPVSGNVLTNDNDPNGDPLTATVPPNCKPQNGTFTMQTNGIYTYVPNLNFVGTDTFCYLVCDNNGLCDTTNITINVIKPIAQNSVVANDDATQTQANTSVKIVVLANDIDPQGDKIVSATKLSNPLNGTVIFNTLDSSFTYNPNTNFVGEDSFKYIICDSKGACDTATVTVNIIPIIIANDPPVAIDDVNTSLINTPVSGTVAKNDLDPDSNLPLSFSLISGPLNGTINFKPDGTYTYTPNPNFTGNDEVKYKVCDSGTPVACDTATLHLTILPPAPIPPVDIALSKTVVGSSDCKRQMGDEITFRLKVYRQDTQNLAVNNIIVKDSMSAYFEYISASANKGNFDVNSGLWSNISLAKNDTASMDIKVRIKNTSTFIGGQICNEAWLYALGGTDYDSKAGNKIESEDDFVRACVSVPSKICVERLEKISLTAPSGYTNYQWYLNGQVIIGANSQEYIADKPGTYTLKLNNSDCPTGNCCPIYVEDFCECKPNICVPFSIIKVKK